MDEKGRNVRETGNDVMVLQTPIIELAVRCQLSKQLHGKDVQKYG